MVGVAGFEPTIFRMSSPVAKAFKMRDIVVGEVLG